jgi:hypothetical protein
MWLIEVWPIKSLDMLRVVMKDVIGTEFRIW